MASVQHTLQGTTAPSSVPPSLGAHYTNTATGQRWIASGTASVADWGKPIAGQDVRVPATQTLYTVDPSVPRVIWETAPPTNYEIHFGAPPTEPGYYEFELVVEVSLGTPPLVAVTFDESKFDQSLNFDIPNYLIVWPTSATYFKFGLWVGHQVANPYWRLVESRTLDAQKPEYAEVDFQATNWMLGLEAQTAWSVTTEGTKTLGLGQLRNTFPKTFFDKMDLVIWNTTGANVTIQVDASEVTYGGPATLTVPAGEAMLYQFTYFVGSAQHSWVLAGSQQLAPHPA